ncbi:MAG: NlpC/P60 family protein [Rhodospirillales bacterium]
MPDAYRPTRDTIVAAAREYLGVPWRHQGRSRAGLDCVGLLVMVARDLGLSDYDHRAYARTPATAHGFVRHFADNMPQVDLAGARPGEVVVLADPVYPCHCGILSERFGVRYLIHASARYRKVAESPYADEWQTKARFAFAFPGVAA